jgi:hypothetical protein
MLTYCNADQSLGAALRSLATSDQGICLKFIHGQLSDRPSGTRPALEYSSRLVAKTILQLGWALARCY